MSKQITEMPCDFCPPKCPHKDFCIAQHSVYSDNEKVITGLDFSCKHEEACAMWYFNSLKEKTNE